MRFATPSAVTSRTGLTKPASSGGRTQGCAARLLCFRPSGRRYVPSFKKKLGKGAKGALDAALGRAPHGIGLLQFASVEQGGRPRGAATLLHEGLLRTEGVDLIEPDV